ncbi:hypothetical protein FGO68_gene8704 [Halteria grandinella]|uniref:Uncharacterized protein n=1 Tax=Halteria grandinella TaxID=5974 RepID=A0A8J8NV98_HALGN|nr:hypothetical protein FGO68_gene8704 [Halteria grandinella]
MVFCLFASIQLFSTLGFMIQTGSLSTGTTENGFVIGFLALSFAFYITAIVMSFKTYKEFKAIHQEQLGSDIQQASYGAVPMRDEEGDNESKQFPGQGRRLKDY